MNLPFPPCLTAFTQNVAAERLAAEANGKAKAAEKRVSDLEAKLDATIKACRSDRRKAVEEMEVIQSRCEQTIKDLRAEAQKQVEYARGEYEDNVRSIREEAEERVRKIEENAMNDARATALDKVQEAQSDSAAAEAEVQDLRKELERLTEDRSRILDELNQISSKNEREKYVLHEKIEFMEQEYQERMARREDAARAELQALHERQIKEVFKEIEYEKQKLLLYKRSAENELHDNAQTMAEVLAIHERCAAHHTKVTESLAEFRAEVLRGQERMEREVGVLTSEALEVLRGLVGGPAAPGSSREKEACLSALHMKVQKLKASFSYLKFRSKMGATPASTPGPAQRTRQEPEDSAPSTPESGGESPFLAPRRRRQAPSQSSTPRGPPKSVVQSKETFVVANVRRSQSARPSRYTAADISTLKPSSASFTPNFSELKPLKSVKNVTNTADLGILRALHGGSADFNLKDFKKLERKKSGRSTLLRGK